MTGKEPEPIHVVRASSCIPGHWLRQAADILISDAEHFASLPPPWWKNIALPGLEVGQSQENVEEELAILAKALSNAREELQTLKSRFAEELKDAEARDHTALLMEESEVEATTIGKAEVDKEGYAALESAAEAKVAQVAKAWETQWQLWRQCWARAVVQRARELAAEPSNFIADDGDEASYSMDQVSSTTFQGTAGEQNAAVNFNANLQVTPEFNVPFTTHRGRHFWSFLNVVVGSRFRWKNNMSGRDGREKSSEPNGQQNSQKNPIDTSMRQLGSTKYNGAGSQNAGVNFNLNLPVAPRFNVPFWTRRGRHFWYFCNFVLFSDYEWTNNMDGDDGIGVTYDQNESPVQNIANV